MDRVFPFIKAIFKSLKKTLRKSARNGAAIGSQSSRPVGRASLFLFSVTACLALAGPFHAKPAFVLADDLETRQKRIVAMEKKEAAILDELNTMDQRLNTTRRQASRLKKEIGLCPFLQ